MHAHQLVAASPVDVHHHLFTHQRLGLCFERHVDDDVLGRTVPGHAEVDLFAIGAFKKACITRLSARGRIKTGAVQLDPAIRVDGRHHRFRCRKIEVVAVESFNGHEYFARLIRRSGKAR
jgi:hypothetical protein